MTAWLDTLIQTDQQAFLAVNGWHASVLDQFMYLVSDRWVWIPLYVVILVMLLRRYGWRWGLIVAIGAALAMALADQTCATFIRPYVERLRPTHPLNPISSLVHIVNGYRGGAYGFPSCHAANTAASAKYIIMAFPRRRAFVAFMVLWVVLNCWSRMYLGVHYPGDHITGCLIGTAIGLLVGWAQKALHSLWLAGYAPIKDDSQFAWLWPRHFVVQPTTLIYLFGYLLLAAIFVISMIRYSQVLEC